jgi:hypothetical protein
MKNLNRLSLILVLSLFLINCSGNQKITKGNSPSQSSVRIDLVDGSAKEGIVVTDKNNRLVIVNAETHKVDTIRNSQISKVSESVNIYDFYGNTISKAEINQSKNYKNTLLYGAGGLVLGTAVGFGAFVAILVSDSSQTLAANLTMAAFGVAGAVIFGKMGHGRDVNAAIDKVRKNRYKVEQIKMEEERKKLEQLKKERELQKKQNKGK